jgi:hypothetical protein
MEPDGASPPVPLTRRLPRIALWAVLFGGLGYAILAMFGWFDAPAQKAASEARKCGTARRINLLPDAERYCAKAISILNEEKRVPVGVTARVHTEVAALAMLQKRFDESARHCGIALVAWREASDETFIDERQKSIEACERVLAAVKDIKEREKK